MSVEEYIEAQRHNIQEVARLPHFAQLIQQLDELYNHTISIFPSDAPGRYIRFLLLFHKSFLSAATLIGQCQPDDAATITRRAMELSNGTSNDKRLLSENQDTPKRKRVPIRYAP